LRQLGLQAQFPAIKGCVQAWKPEQQRNAILNTAFEVTCLPNHIDRQPTAQSATGRPDLEEEDLAPVLRGSTRRLQ
jgi:hypothetical protein